MHWVAAIHEITPIFSELQDDAMPFGLPVYFPLGARGARDRVNAELGKAGIGLTIHWDDICSDPRTNQNPLAVDMAGRMLTLAIDQRIRHKQLDLYGVEFNQWDQRGKDVVTPGLDHDTQFIPQVSNLLLYARVVLFLLVQKHPHIFPLSLLLIRSDLDLIASKHCII